LRCHQDYNYTAVPNVAGDGEGEVDDAGDRVLFDMYEILDIITADDAAGYFAHAGYF
jgi:hypothetical protein